MLSRAGAPTRGSLRGVHAVPAEVPGPEAGALGCPPPGPEAVWQGRRDSNSQPPVLETGALPIELHP